MKPCLHGHISERNSHGACLECNRLASAKSRAANPESRRQTARKHYAANREKRLANSAAWVVKNPEKLAAWKADNADRIAAYSKRHFEKNREIKIAKLKQWREDNPERLRAAIAAWAANNPEAIRVHARNRRARLKATGGVHTVDDVAAIAKMQKHRCAYCRTSLSRVVVHVDHIEPVALGGSNDRQNLQILCQPCNQAKHCKPPMQFARERGLLL